MKLLPPPGNAVRRALPRLLLAASFAGFAGGLTGCLNLKPRENPARHFLLTPVTPPTGTNAVAGTNAHFTVGLGPVVVPGYVRHSSLAIRTAGNEIRYDELRQWAERLEDGIPRVLAANLRTFLPQGQVRTAAWRRNAVGCELYLTLERFDVDEAGRGILQAHWRITAPGGDPAWRHGQASLSCEGPAPAADPAGAVGTLSQLLGELAHQVTEDLATGSGPAAR